MTMSSIRTILTVGAIFLGAAVLQNQAAGQATSSSSDRSAVAGRNASFFGYTGFIGDRKANASIPSVDRSADAPIPTGTFAFELPKTGFIKYVQDDTPDVPTPPEIPLAIDEAVSEASDCGCDDKGCSGESCKSCGPLFRDPWVSFEYMHAWARGRWLPPLVTTSPPGVNGVLPNDGINPNARVLFGDEYIGSGLQASGRVSIGAWLGEDDSLGVGARFLSLEGDSTAFAAASNAAGNPVIARPFFNTDPIFNAPDSLIVTAAGLRTGDLLATAENDVLGAETYLRYAVLRETNRRADLLLGYHYTRIDDSLNINHRMRQIGGVIPIGTRFVFEDLFDVQNEFHGVELGVLSEFDRGPFTLSLMGKMSMGNMQETLTISGKSSRTPPAGVPAVFTGGLLAMPTNIGTYSRDDFAVIPEAEFKVICRITERLEASIGYSLLYWSDVALAGQQIDVSRRAQPTVNASQLEGGALVGPANPAFSGIRDTDFWLQALSVGFTFKH